jgi:hypothetical protein
MSSLRRGFRVNEDELIPIFIRVGTNPFTHLEIADIIIPQTVTKYANDKYFLPIKDANGRRVRSAGHAFVWRLNQEVVKLCEEAIAEQGDHRWRNLAEGLTGGEHP